MESISNKIAATPNDEKLLDKYTHILNEYEKERGYTYKNEINEYLSRFNFDNSFYDRKISSLSGGERMKIAFIKILLFKYNVLLLDEPTNHLDVSTIEWLENFLKDYDGTILFISHDRYFLNTLADKVLELENHKITSYNCSYDNFLVLKQQNYENLIKQAAKEDALIEKYKRFIEFYMPKPRFVGRAKDRVHKLAKLEANKTVIPEKENKKINFKIEGSNLSSKQLVSFENCVIGYDRPLCPPFSFIFYGQDKLAIIGDNGIGKTTLIKSIIKDIPLFSGEIKYLRKLKIGYIKQNDYVFNKNETALSYLREKYPALLDKELRTALGRFQFKGEDVFKDTSLMSNGEKMRLTLCAFSMSDYDILLLDEPTNHLDLITKECLISSLKSYKGAIIFVSHDRYFINELATHTLFLSKEKSIFNEGNYDDFKLYNEKTESIEKEKKVDVVVPIENKKDEKEVVKVPYIEKLSNNAIQKLNEEVAAIEKEMTEIDNKLNDPNTKYTEYKSLDETRGALEDRYLEIIDILDKQSKI